MRRMTMTRGDGRERGTERPEGAESEAPWHGLLAPEWAPAEIDTDHAHPSRIYDYLLGGYPL